MKSFKALPAWELYTIGLMIFLVGVSVAYIAQRHPLVGFGLMFVVVVLFIVLARIAKR